jgi:CubicO group peptidase (beta-lactamase class C family)
VRVTPEQLEPAFASLASDVAEGRVGMAALAIGDAEGTIRKQVFSPVAGHRYDAESLFFMASVSKPIFATAVMQLVEEGLLDLHAPIARQLPEFDTPEREQVTIWHLLSHTSGLEDVSPELIRRTRPSGRRLTDLSLHAPLHFTPGTRWQYASSSYFVLAELARRVTGEPLSRLLERRVFEPLGMTDVGFDPRGRGRPIMPVAGIGADNRLIRFLLLRYMASIAHPGGGLWGTLDDVLCFGAAWLAPRQGPDGRWLPLRPETMQLMSEDQTHGVPALIDGEERPMHHGLGWSKPTLMRDLPGSPAVIDHGGASGARLWVDPQAGICFAYFANQWRASRDAELKALAEMYRALGEPATAGRAASAAVSAAAGAWADPASSG